MFLVRTDDSWSHKGRINGVYFTVINDRRRFEEMDKGGTMYVLPSDTFTTDVTKNMGTTEWISKKPVKPMRKENYVSGLEAMIQYGVQVYFVDMDTWLRIENSEDHGFSILSKETSVNQERDN